MLVFDLARNVVADQPLVKDKVHEREVDLKVLADVGAADGGRWERSVMRPYDMTDRSTVVTVNSAPVYRPAAAAGTCAYYMPVCVRD